MGRVRVVLDARPLSHPQPGGFKSYVRALLLGLTAAPPSDIDLLLYLDRPLAPESMRLVPPGASIRLLSPSRLKTDLLLFRRQVRRDGADIVHGTMNYAPPGLPCPTVLTLHDAMGIKRYSWDRHTPRTLRERLIHRYWAAMTVGTARHAARIVTPSQFSREEIAGTLRLPPQRFAVVPNGIALPAPTPGIVRRTNTVLALASPDLRKNLGALWSALLQYRDRFASAPPHLIVACTSERTAAHTREALAAHHLSAELLVAPDDQRLADAYAEANVFVWPSHLEGFGLPPLEAMRCGCPVVSSNAPSMPEVLGDIPAYFPPDRPDLLADILSRVLQDTAQCDEMTARGRAHAAHFSCTRMAAETADVWRAVE